MVRYDLRQAYVVGSNHSIHLLCYTLTVAPYWAGMVWGRNKESKKSETEKLNTSMRLLSPHTPPGGELEKAAALLPQEVGKQGAIVSTSHIIDYTI